MNHFRYFLAGALCVFAFGVDAASAGIALTLDVPGHGNNNNHDENMSATVEFSVTGSTLLLTVTNNSPMDSGFDVTAVYFNALPHVTGMSLDTPAFLDPPTEGWRLVFDERADGFGRFDFGLLSELGNDPDEILPQESRQFEFSISGNGPFEDADFTTEFSTIPPGNSPALAAAKFVNGPHPGGAFVGVIPEPATISLLLVGLGLLTRKSHRRN